MTKVKTVPRTEVRGSHAYHVWFSPRRRKPALQGDIASAATRLLKDIAAQRNIELLECEPSYDHVHLLLELPPDITLPKAMQYLKGASSRHLFQEFPGLKLDLGHNHFWQRGYGARPVPADGLKVVSYYIRAHSLERQPRTSVRGDDSNVPSNPNPGQEHPDD